jgi:hypothetical protein
MQAEGLDGPGRRIELAGVADHVAVREVADDRIELAAADGGDQAVGHLDRTHFGLQIVGGDPRRRHQDPLFAGVRGLDAAAEEIGDVRVFLGLGDAQLGQAQR